MGQQNSLPSCEHSTENQPFATSQDETHDDYHAPGTTGTDRQTGYCEACGRYMPDNQTKSTTALQTTATDATEKLEIKSPKTQPLKNTHPDLLPGISTSGAFGHELEYLTGPPELFDSSLNLYFPDILKRINACQAASSSLSYPPVGSPSQSLPPSPFTTSFGIIGKSLYLHTTRHVHATSPEALHRLWSGSEPERWMHPCQHLAFGLYHDIPVRSAWLRFVCSSC